MRLRIALIGIIALVFVVITTTLQANNKKPLKASSKSKNTEKVIGVETLMKSPNHYRGSVKVEGVVSAISLKHKTLALIDRKEFKNCRVTTCARLTLPVQWHGPMPAIQDEILIQGKIRSINKKLVFVASTLEKLPPRSLKGSHK